jgi:hypothetical protein
MVMLVHALSVALGAARMPPRTIDLAALADGRVGGVTGVRILGVRMTMQAWSVVVGRSRDPNCAGVSDAIDRRHRAL